jgi:P4 family phage/plasmid primase-like protien
MEDRMKNVEKYLKKLSFVDRVGAGCDNIFVNIVYEFVVGEVVYSNKEWWVFDGIWRSDDGEYLWGIITDFLPRWFQDDVDVEGVPITDAIRYLGSVATSTRLMRSLTSKLSDRSFYNRLNSNPGLIGMRNGTYIFDENAVRDGLSTDFLTMSCGVGFVREVCDHDLEGLGCILRQIFPKKEVLNFFIMSCASMLEGCNEDKVFYCWWGKGSNGKTLMQEFISYVFGDYAASLSTSLITGRKASSFEATPDMQYAKDKLVVFLPEPNPDERIQVGRLKELTGDDSVYARDLYKVGGKMKFRAKIVIVANNALEAPRMDVAFRERMLVIPFESVFTNSEDSNRYTFPRDKRMKKKMFKYGDVFMNVILNEHSKNGDKELVVPQYILDKTSEYVTINNHPLKFIRTKLSRCLGCIISLEEIYDDFKSWYCQGYPGRKIPPRDVFSTELSNEGYEEVGGDVVNVAYVGQTFLKF